MKTEPGSGLSFSSGIAGNFEFKQEEKQISPVLQGAQTLPERPLPRGTTEAAVECPGAGAAEDHRLGDLSIRNVFLTALTFEKFQTQEPAISFLGESSPLGL